MDSFNTAYNRLNQFNYNAVCSISGGADSDIMLDLLSKIDDKKKIKYVWFDTGLEYQATKDHLNYLRNRYKVNITVCKAKKPIPTTCREYGQPFLNKKVSEFLYRLQHHNFKFTDDSYDHLIKEYPNCKSALQWYCNQNADRMNISRNKWLKEFLIENPPKFKISNKCCEYAKKKVVHDYIKQEKAVLNLVGVRKAEGGERSRLTSCFTPGDVNLYRPIFWYKNEDKAIYERFFGVCHSRCYTEYGLTRTGCAGCPFGRNYENELQVIQKFEPKLYKAVNNIFADSYVYTRQYKEYVWRMNNRNQITIFDLMKEKKI